METYNGHVRTPADAIVLFEACRLGLLPRVQRRLSEKERQSIKSGSVFVWDEREAGMRRWTDGKSWSASRVSGSFLTYREMEGKRGGSGFSAPLAAPRAGKTPESARGSDSDLEHGGGGGGGGEDGPDGYRYKPDGLMKQSFSITTSSGNHLHLISYYSRTHPNAQGLNNPTSDPNLRHIRPQKGMYPESTVHEQPNIPAVTRAPMVSAPFSTVPRIANYARASPPQQTMNYPPQGYSWTSQPPIPTPQHAYGYPYAANGAPPQSNGHANLPYAHSSSHPNPQPPRPSAYDRPPVAQNENLPPPPQPQRSNIGPRPSPPDYATPSSRLAGPSMQAQQAQQHPPPPPQHLPAPSAPVPTTAGRPSSPPSLSKIDPRLMAPSPLAQEAGARTHVIDSRTPSPRPVKQEGTDATPTRANGTSQASTIPSIGSLMNNASADNADAKSDVSNRSNRSASRSPGGTQTKDGPQDIPSDKMIGFGEDARALRVLDRAFKT